jgi:ATP-dependent Clp protease ATP-binding subunit ClpB
VSRLIGAPPGYVGYDEGGQLTEVVRRRPYSVLLLDEVEKAHTDVFNVLLQLLDEGRLTDGQGRTVDFRNTVVIMTSNLGSAAIMDTDLSEELIQQRVMAEVRGHFRPEFLNRVDDIVIFHRLAPDHLRQIVDIQVLQLERRLAERSIAIELTDKAREYLAERGFDPAYGARPLKRLMQREISDALALRLLQGEYADGDRVEIDASPNGLEFRKI